jgi:hypothetical protein
MRVDALENDLGRSEASCPAGKCPKFKEALRVRLPQRRAGGLGLLLVQLRDCEVDVMDRLSEDGTGFKLSSPSESDMNCLSFVMLPRHLRG